MIRLRQGDRLPTVAVVQSYLNQHTGAGEVLRVDGSFGPRTEAAVRRFRAANRLPPGGTVDYLAWARIVGEGWQVIDSVDRSDHDNEHRILDHEDLAPFGQTVLEQFGLSGGAAVVLNSVRAHGRPGQVVLLRFHGHGSPGHMLVSSGRTGTGSSFHHSYGAGFLNALRPLRHLFAPFGSVEMHGCRIGLGVEGQRLLSHMADALGVPVTGAVQRQLGGGAFTFRFEGPTTTVCPNGESLRTWSQRVGSASEPRPARPQPRDRL